MNLYLQLLTLQMKQHKNTKIVCTLGPSTNSVSTICKLIRAGMNIARLNFSHGDHNEQGQIIKNIHQAEKITGQKIAVMQDLQGPKIRLGFLPTEGVFIKKNEIIIFNCDIKYRFIKNLIGLINIPITYAKLYKDLKKGDVLFIDEIHRLSKVVEEFLYPAMENFKIDFIVSLKNITIPFVLMTHWSASST